ncbi:hypothetical protein PSHT_15996 [Puccinia striiformis]|uniref:Uncharacterized protein n=1 Tax=Puccinia striiformis TaxID=27350 RepID=A0A2S4UC13_9BASI|nr:hypothetical protein PSHT_15996 [Puccinia striiformis]
MSLGRTPNHPLIVSGHFEPLSPSVPESARGNQYGFVSTLSYFQCSGIGGRKADAFEVTLKTNTLLTHTLEPGSIYYLSGKLIAMNDGSTPVISYSENSVVKVCEAGDNQPDFKSKAGVVGLGHVSKREEVVGTDDDGGNRLEVEVVHHDWDVQERCHRRFLVKYIIPSAKNMLKTHTLYVVGREAEVVGNLVDFDVHSNMVVVMVSSVSLTSGHLVGRMVPLPSGSDSPSPRKGLNFVKPSPKKDVTPGSSAAILARATPLTPKDSDFSNDDPKGKRKKNDENAYDENDEVESDKSDAMDIEVNNPPKGQGTRAAARKAVLQAAAKRMKRL